MKIASCWVAIQLCGLSLLLGYLCYLKFTSTRHTPEYVLQSSSNHLMRDLLPKNATNHTNPPINNFNISKILLAPINTSAIPLLTHPGIPRVMNEKQHRNVTLLMERIDKLFTENNITYIMAYGTLLGSYINHDVLPWDDDLDLMVKLSDKKKILQILQDKSKCPQIGGMEHKAHPSHMIKVYARDSPSAGGYKWKWPFADIAYFDENKTHVWNVQKKAKMTFNRTSFYPLHRRPYDGLWIPAQREPNLFFKNNYGAKFECRSFGWNHQRERRDRKRQVKVDCSTIEEYYPMVHRTPYRDGMLETLRLKGKDLYTVYVDEPPPQDSFSPF